MNQQILNDNEKEDIFVIAICGNKGNGKDTIGNWCKKELGAIRLAFGEPLKRGVRQFFDFTEEQVTNEQEKEKIDPYWNHSPREFYQIFGTEICQYFLPKILKNMDKNIWVKCLERKMTRIYRSRPNIYNIFVITDIRFSHEESFVKSFPNHLIIQVNRNNHNNSNNNDHISETTLNILRPNYIVENNKTIKDLYHKINKIIINNKIKKLKYCEKLILFLIKKWDHKYVFHDFI